jgi:O-succinylbenzoate synthase
MALRITNVSMHRVALPLVHEFQTSSHRKSSIDHILVKLTSEDGSVGWGEIATGSDPFFAAESTGTAWSIGDRYLVPAIVGSSWTHPSETARLWNRVRGNYFARAGFDMAAWSLWAAAQGHSLSAALGGERTEVSAGVSLGIEPSIGSLLDQVAVQVDAGYERVKLKIAPGWDLEPARRVREAFPGIQLHVDANAIYGPDDIDTVAALDGLGLSMIEQPFGVRDFATHALLQSRIETPICLDESIETLDDVATMLALGAGRIINIKVSRLGGLTNALAVHDLALRNNVPVWCGGMHEFGIGRLANVAISSLPGFTMPSDVSASDKYYARDLIDPPVVARAGMVAVPTVPGLGSTVDEEFIVASESQRLDAHV